MVVCPYVSAPCDPDKDKHLQKIDGWLDLHMNERVPKVHEKKEKGSYLFVSDSISIHQTISNNLLKLLRIHEGFCFHQSTDVGCCTDTSHL